MSAEPAEPRRESPGGVVGVGLGLLLLAVASLALLRLGPRELDPRELLEADFELGPLPFPGVVEEPSAAPALPLDWSRLPEGPAGTPPVRVYLLRYGEGGATRALARHFRNLEWRELADIEERGGRTVVEGGRLRWGEFDADFVRERRFLPGPGFQDSLRINLGLPKRYWIAFAFWPRGLPGSKEPCELLLKSLRARSAEEVGGSPDQG
jgi:hypothetical protein